MANKYPANYPKVLVKGSKGHVWDDIGNEYIDLIAGLGAISVGYANDVIDNAAYVQMRKGTIFSLPNPIEYEVAKRLTELIPETEQWKFGKNGTDGTVMAVRCSRAYTGRTKIMTVGYNGCQEMFECKGVRSAGIPEVLREHNTKAFYNDLESFKDLYTKEYACVIMEPMVYEYPRTGFLEYIRYMCAVTGTILIFDEVVNGGRFKDFVSSKYFKVKPDLYVLSKGIANGFPLCAVGGAKAIMSVFERDDFFASGTFGGECVSLSAALATMGILQKSIDKMIWNGSRIQDAFNSLWKDAKCVGYPTRLVFQFKDNKDKYRFWQEMCKQGILVGYTNFIMADHTDDDVTKIINAIYAVYKIWDTVELEGPEPVEAIKKNG